MEVPCVSFHLRRLTRRVSAVYDRHFAQVGLRGTQYSVLSLIGAQPLIGTAVLATELGMDRSTLSRNLRPLVRAGWVKELRPPPGVLADSRSLAVELTEAGHLKRKEGVTCWRRAQAEIADLFGQENRDLLLQTLQRSYASLEDAGKS